MKINDLLFTFQANRQVTKDILDTLPEDELHRKWDRPGLDTYAKHFEELALVLIAYSKAFETKNMDFSDVPSVFEFSGNKNKEELRVLLKESEKILETALQKVKPEDEVFWFDMSLPAEIHFINIISHEVLHQGMMIMDMYAHNLEIPTTLLENWSLPSAKK